MLTSENIVNAVNAAGFSSEEEFASALKLARQVLTRNRLQYQMQKLEAERRADNQEKESQLAVIAADIASLDTAIAANL